MRKSPSSLLQMAMVGVTLWTAPSYLWSQGVSPSEQSSSIKTQPFDDFDRLLAKAADSLLVPVIIQAQGGKSAPSYDLPDDQSHRFSGDNAQSAATGRLNQLRPTVDPILRNRGVPAELAAVILVESGGRVDALSPKGARGLWQLMPDTARRYGLHVDEIRDDRLDLPMATDAAARYLHDLYAQFGDWKLALAAYNSGEANLSSAIVRAHSHDFDQLTNLRVLPLETRNYVPRVLAAANLLGHSSSLVSSRSDVTATTVFAVSTP